MIKPEISPYQRLGSLASSLGNTKRKKFWETMVSRENIIMLPMAFLLGRASFAGGLMPFGMVIYAATIGLSINRVLVAALVILGMVSGGATVQIYTSIAGMFLFNAFNIPFKNSKKRLNLRYSLIASISILLPQLLISYMQGFLLYDILKALFQGVLVFSLMFVMRKAIPVIENKRENREFSNEEIISIVIVGVFAITGLSDVMILGFSVKSVFCILLILLLSFKRGPGVGAAIGVAVGLIISMSTVAAPVMISTYAFCGLLSGVFRGLGKIGSGLGFVMGNAILTLYLNGSTEVIIYLKEIILAAAVFSLIPIRLIDTLLAALDKNETYERRDYSSRIKEITVEKLTKFSRTFNELSKTFSEISETSATTEKQDISELFDRVADRACKGCSLAPHCWDRNFYNTYQVLFKIVEKLDIKGSIEESDIPKSFLQRCERINEFVESVNNVYEIFRVNMVWKNKIGESRGLVSQQLEGLSKVISNLAFEINMDIHFKSDLEDLILNNLDKAGHKINEIIVYENKWGKFEINIFQKDCGGKRICRSLIEKVVSESVGRKMIKEDSDCKRNGKTNSCSLKLIEEEVFRVTTGVAKLAKCGEDVSGDSYTFMSTGDGKYMVALSDGMGSGQRASIQSRATMSMLEQFMESGFDKDTTIKIINSILILKSSEDSFATIDVSIIDLYEGLVESVKIGAAPTFIKKRERVEVIKSASLPAGILGNIETELAQKKIESGDFIIMVSDGITDSFNIEEDKKSERRIKDFIRGIGSVNPQKIADSILERAYENCEGEPMDDMMVVVAKMWKRVS